MKHYFTYISFALALFLSALIYSTCIKRTKGFSYIKIHSRHPYNHRWDFGPPSKNQQELLNKIASQTFSLLGSGKECYAFVSADGKIVVKFFKQKHMRTQYILNYFPLPKAIQTLRNEMLNRHQTKRNTLYQSYQIAYERLQEETRVLYLHLTKTKNLKQTIHLKTPKGKNLILLLDNMEFLVQERAFSIFDQLNIAPEKGKQIIPSIIHFIEKQNAKGIGDSDINCEKNLGVIGNDIIQIDLGAFYPSVPKSDIKEEVKKATFDLKAFLEKNHSGLVSFLENQVNTLH